jgi:hypothetical protein
MDQAFLEASTKCQQWQKGLRPNAKGSFWHDPDPPSRLQSGRYPVANGPEQAALSGPILPNPPSALLVSAPRSRVLCPLFRLGRGYPISAPSSSERHKRDHPLRNTATVQPCNTRLGSQFARLWQQLHHLGHRVANDDPRRPTSAGLQADKITSVGCLPQLAGLIRKQRPNRPPAIAPLLKIPFGGYPAVVAAELAVHRGGDAGLTCTRDERKHRPQKRFPAREHTCAVWSP